MRFSDPACAPQPSRVSAALAELAERDQDIRHVDDAVMVHVVSQVLCPYVRGHENEVLQRDASVVVDVRAHRCRRR